MQTDAFYTVSIPHQRPAEVTTWPSQEAAMHYYVSDRRRSRAWWAADTYGTGHEEEPTDWSAAEEWAAHDLSSFRSFETLEELEEWAREYATSSGPHPSGGHQSGWVLVQVEGLIAARAEDAATALRVKADAAAEELEELHTKEWVALYDPQALSARLLADLEAAVAARGAADPYVGTGEGSTVELYLNMTRLSGASRFRAEDPHGEPGPTALGATGDAIEYAHQAGRRVITFDALILALEEVQA
jgi:hypothetical protein